MIKIDLCLLESCLCLALLCLCGAFLLAGGAPASARADAFGAGARAYARQDYVRAANILGPLAENGDARAQTYLGFMYFHGRGVPQNYTEAAIWCCRAWAVFFLCVV